MNRTLVAPLFFTAAAGVVGAQSTLVEERGPAAGDRMGFAVAGGFDFDLDGFDDVIVGNPFDDVGGLTDNGSVMALSGRDGSILSFGSGANDDDHMGWSVALVDDMDGDGWPELVAGAPNALDNGIRPGMVRVISSRTWTQIAEVHDTVDGAEFGYSVTGGFDANGDGVPDYAVGAPRDGNGWACVYSGASHARLTCYGTTSPAALLGSSMTVASGLDLVVGAPGADNDRGQVTAIDPAAATFLFVAFGDAEGDRYGSALAEGADVNGDGLREVLVGAPRASTTFPDAGQILLLDVQNVTTLTEWHGDAEGDRLGSSLATLGDVVGGPAVEFAAGATEQGFGDGSVRVFSFNSSVERYRVPGAPGSHFGFSVARAGDANDDGFADFVAGGPRADDPNDPLLTEVGLLRIHSGGGPGFVPYCTAGVSASGCQPQISAAGTPSETLPNGFFLSASLVEGGKIGQFFYGANGRQANLWGNGSSFQCVAPPVKRGGLLVPSGASGTCDGWFLQDLNARWCPTCPKPSHNFGAGAVVQAQLWYRDPASTSNQTTSLSSAVELVVGP